METRGVAKMKNCMKALVITIIFVLAILPQTVFGIEVDALKEMLDKGEKVTVIDIRSLKLYTENQILGAINIPAGIIARKPLPPIGSVVVCGDGIRKDITMKAVEELNSKAGIQAEPLEGGFAAWQALNSPSTQSTGMKSERFRYITYEELKKAAKSNQNMVLVDLRLPVQNKIKAGRSKSKDSKRNLSNFSEKFPALEVVALDYKNSNSDNGSREISISALSSIKDIGHNKVYVLVDRGNGKSEKVARRLYGAGIKQVVILVGGERILQREGQTSLQTEVTGESL